MAGAFSENIFRAFCPPGAIQKNKKKTHTHTHTYTHTSPTHTSNSFVWLMFRFGTGYTVVVAGVGIADGSRAQYDVGISPLSSSAGGLDMILYWSYR